MKVLERVNRGCATGRRSDRTANRGTTSMNPTEKAGWTPLPHSDEDLERAKSVPDTPQTRAADLPAGLERRRVHDAARTAAGQAAARTAEARDDPGRARHPLDGHPVRRRAHSRARRRGLGGQERDAEEEPRGEQPLLRGGAQVRAALLAAFGDRPITANSSW